MLSKEPIVGVRMHPPLNPPREGEVIIGYQAFQEKPGCCRCDGMTQDAQFTTLILLVIFAPVAWIPCVMKKSFAMQQRPVYGPPGSMPVDDNEVVTKGASASSWNVNAASDSQKYVRV
ncbi:hypothetical protein WJX73_000230 [Symbiochloris irregularis]|uniref:Uncharacterized protein n=1 Tax=Symbiochloris irregularis TaxID=706552 RepID=A0AAW1PIZ4_9CHLO